MANKRYDEFSADVTEPARIALHADPATGELKKATLAEFTGCLNAGGDAPNANNSGSNPQTIATVVIPARYTDPIGSWIEAIALADCLSTTGPPVISLRMNGGDVVPLNCTAAGQIRLELWAQRVSTTHIRSMRFNTRVLTNAGAGGSSNIAINQGTDLTFEIVITAGAASALFVVGLHARVFTP